MKHNFNELLTEGKKIHGNKYDYSKVKYINWKTKVDIKCNNCGIIFQQSPQLHINRKHGCRICNSRKLSKIEIIKRCNSAHNNFYIYPENMKYNGYYNSIDIICKKHGAFKLTPKRHIDDKIGCKECELLKIEKIRKKKEKKFIERSKKIHNNLYTYENIHFTKTDKCVSITCMKHGAFEQLPSSHLRGNGCKKCSDHNFSVKYTSNLSNFIRKANEIHNNLYTYENSIYTSAINNITITCKKHGDFQQLVNNHLSGSGCPLCKSSKGELKIFNFLTSNNIKHYKQKTFEKCVSHKNNKLKFDFYIPHINMCIEYDGEFHYKDIFGKGKLNKQIELDNIKTKFCENNNIKLLRIPYWKLNEIDIIMNEIIN